MMDTRRVWLPIYIRTYTRQKRTDTYTKIKHKYIHTLHNFGRDNRFAIQHFPSSYARRSQSLQPLQCCGGTSISKYDLNFGLTFFDLNFVLACGAWFWHSFSFKNKNKTKTRLACALQCQKFDLICIVNLVQILALFHKLDLKFCIAVCEYGWLASSI